LKSKKLKQESIKKENINLINILLNKPENKFKSLKTAPEIKATDADITIS
jgi:hypothetical protein